MEYRCGGGAATIVQGDCLAYLKTMESKSVDCVITSPPYNTLGKRIPRKPSGMHKTNKWLAKVSAQGYSDSMPEPDYQAWVRAIVGECLRVCRGLVWINHKTRYRSGVAVHPLHFLPFPIYSEIVWDRAGSLAFNCRRFAPSHEFIWGFGSPSYWDDSGNSLLSVWRMGPRRSKEHPCPFPIEIPRRLIRASCPPNGIVLDPFSGIATTGQAALELGRQYIGCETNPDWVRLSVEKLGGSCTGR